MTDVTPPTSYDPPERFVEDVLVDEPPMPLTPDEDGEADLGGEG